MLIHVVLIVMIAALVVGGVGWGVFISVCKQDREHAEFMRQIEGYYACQRAAVAAMPTQTEMERERARLVARFSCHNVLCHGFGKHPCHDLNCIEHDMDAKRKARA